MESQLSARFRTKEQDSIDFPQTAQFAPRAALSGNHRGQRVIIGYLAWQKLWTISWMKCRHRPFRSS